MNNMEIMIVIIAIILCTCLSIVGKVLIECGINPFTQKLRTNYKINIGKDNFDILKNKLVDLLKTFNKSDEVDILLNYQKEYTHKERSEIAHKYDSQYVHFKEYIDKDTYKKIIKEIKCVLVRLKYYFKEKRPKSYSQSINPVFLISAQSPRYPSGHTAQYYYLYLYLKNKYPNDSDKLKKIMENGAESRLIAGVHFPIDNKAGIGVAKFIYNILH